MTRLSLHRLPHGALICIVLTTLLHCRRASPFPRIKKRPRRPRNRAAGAESDPQLPGCRRPSTRSLQRRLDSRASSGPRRFLRSADSPPQRADGTPKYTNRLIRGVEPLPAPARPQPRQLVSLVRRGVRPCETREQACVSLGGLLDLPLVSRDGARVLRGRGHCRVSQPSLHRHQGRPGGTARRGQCLHDRRRRS